MSSVYRVRKCGGEKINLSFLAVDRDEWWRVAGVRVWVYCFVDSINREESRIR